MMLKLMLLIANRHSNWRRESLPTPVFWPGEFHGLYSPWRRKELDTIERLSLYFISGIRMVAQKVKNPPAMWDTWVWSLGWEDILEKGMATHSCFLCLENSMDRGASQATVHGVPKSHTWPSDFQFTSGIRIIYVGKL